MRVLCAPDSFKGTLSAPDAAAAMAAGVALAGGEADVCPVADGGEGTMDVLVAARGGTIRRERVTGPLGEPVDARYALLDRVGVVELAEAAGFVLVPPDRRDPTRTTTYGVGELVRRAIDDGATEIIVCIGGSGTCDGATGLAQALGARFFDGDDRPITTPLTGGMLTGIARYEPPASLPPIRVACDVTNPLCGPKGSAHVYGPQKGATPDQVESLDAGLAHLAAVVGADPNVPGYGAAGGAGFGLVELLGARLERGIDLVLDAVRFDARCAEADLVLTGEGRLDEQSLHGKTTMGVARRADALGVPAIAIVGTTGAGWQHAVGASDGRLTACVSLVERLGSKRALTDAPVAVREMTARVVRNQQAKSTR
jgi:glycerate kinase